MTQRCANARAYPMIIIQDLLFEVEQLVAQYFTAPIVRSAI